MGERFFGVEQEIHKYNIKKIYVPENRGPCAGVNSAFEGMDQVLEIVGGREKVFSLWDVVHNKAAMNEREGRGLVSANYNLRLIPDSSITIKPAHGGPPWLEEYAKEHNWHMIDLTCVLVEKNHTEIRKDAERGKKNIILGVTDHPETVGMIGVLEELKKEEGRDYILLEGIDDVEKSDLGTGYDWVVRSQTTLMPTETKALEDRLKVKYPDIYVPDRLGICYATYNRQAALDDMVSRGIQKLIVVGSAHSHNSQMLRRRGEMQGVESYSVDYPEELKPEWFSEDVKEVGVTSGASVLDKYLEPVLANLVSKSKDARIEYLDQVKREPKDAMYPLPQKEIDALKARYAA